MRSYLCGEFTKTIFTSLLEFIKLDKSFKANLILFLLISFAPPHITSDLNLPYS
jgi:hypothetical protein